MEYKIEHDSMGEVKVPADKYWGAQTERSHENFEIGVGIETMPREITKAFGYLKKAAAMANNALKSEKMTDEKLFSFNAIVEHCLKQIIPGTKLSIKTDTEQGTAAIRFSNASVVGLVNLEYMFPPS